MLDVRGRQDLTDLQIGEGRQMAGQETRTFALPSLEGGELLRVLGQEQTELLQFMRRESVGAGEAKYKGRIAITVDYTVIGDIVDVTGDFTVKRPKIKRKTERQWVGKGGQLLGAPPKQEALPFAVRAVPDPQPEDETEPAAIAGGEKKKPRSV